MDSTAFDSVARFFGNGLTRREAVRGLAMGLTAVVSGALLLDDPVAEAGRRRRRKQHRRREMCGKQGDGCGALDDNGEYTAPYCCHGYACVYHPDEGATWTCEALNR